MSKKLKRPTLPLKVKIITYSEENPECSLSEIVKYMAEDIGRLLAKSTIRIILKNYSKFTTEICSHSRVERDQRHDKLY